MVPVMVRSLLEGMHGAISANPYTQRVLPHTPAWLRIDNPAVIQAYYSGRSSLFEDGNARAFVGPFIWWGGALVAFVLMSFSINTLLRYQWSRNEHLNYPVTQLPIAMASQTAGGLMSNRLFKVGFGFAGGITLLNGCHFLWPVIPGIPIDHLSEMRSWIRSPIWDVVHWTPISMSPYAIGMAFMIPLDLLFSLWFFTWVWKAERLIGMSMGINVSYWSMGTGWPHHAHQMIGVWLAILGTSLWTARHHLRNIVRQVFHRETGSSIPSETIRYSAALAGLIIGTLGMMSFFLIIGISPIMAIPYALALPGFFLVVARIRAELGPPIQDLQGAGPDRMIYTFISPLGIGPRSWVTMKTSTFWTHLDAATTCPSGAHIDALRLGEVGGALNRRFWIALVVVALAGGALAYWLVPYIGYMRPEIKGTTGGQCGAICTWKDAVATFEDATPRPNWGEVTAMGFGSILTVGLYFLRGLGLRIPLHPIAYLMSAGVPMSLLWFPILVAWFTKLIILRYGGLALYRRTLPLFFGLILGQFVVGIGWKLIGIIFNIRTYTFYA